MSKRSNALRYPEGTTAVGTARVRGIVANPISRSVAASAVVAGQIGEPSEMGQALRRLTKPVKPAKYRNQKCESGGIKFDSKREMMRWHDLVRMQERGEISDLERQVVFVLCDPVVIGGRKRPALRYVADFVYVRQGDERQTVEDVKGRVTEGYRIKRHLMAARGIEIQEIR